MKRHEALDSLHERLMSLWRSVTEHRVANAQHADVQSHLAHAQHADLQTEVRRVLDGLEPRLREAADDALDLHATADGLGSAAYFELGCDYASRLKRGTDVYWFMQKSSRTMFLFHTRGSLARLQEQITLLEAEYEWVQRLVGSDGVDS